VVDVVVFGVVVLGVDDVVVDPAGVVVVEVAGAVVVVVDAPLLATRTPVMVVCGGRGSVVPLGTNPADTSELDPSLSPIGSATLTRLVSGSVFDQ
jgi:hypothetical protein